MLNTPECGTNETMRRFRSSCKRAHIRDAVISMLMVQYRHTHSDGGLAAMYVSRQGAKVSRHERTLGMSAVQCSTILESTHVLFELAQVAWSTVLGSNRRHKGCDGRELALQLFYARFGLLLPNTETDRKSED